MQNESSKNIICDCRNLDIGTKLPVSTKGIINSTSIKQISRPWGEVNFSYNRIIIGSAICHIESTPYFVISIPGTYQVIFTSNVTHESTDNNTIISTAIAINKGIILSSNVRDNIGVNKTKSITSQTIITVPQNVQLIIKIINTSDIDVIYTNPNITIIKL